VRDLLINLANDVKQHEKDVVRPLPSQIYPADVLDRRNTNYLSNIMGQEAMYLP